MQIGAIGRFFLLVNLWAPLILLLNKVLWTNSVLAAGIFFCALQLKIQ